MKREIWSWIKSSNSIVQICEAYFYNQIFLQPNSESTPKAQVYATREYVEMVGLQNKALRSIKTIKGISDVRTQLALKFKDIGLIFKRSIIFLLPILGSLMSLKYWLPCTKHKVKIAIWKQVNILTPHHNKRKPKEKSVFEFRLFA